MSAPCEKILCAAFIFPLTLFAKGKIRARRLVIIIIIIIIIVRAAGH